MEDLTTLVIIVVEFAIICVNMSLIGVVFVLELSKHEDNFADFTDV